jgi:hypothetical protein
MFVAVIATDRVFFQPVGIVMFIEGYQDNPGTKVFFLPLLELPLAS